MDTTATTTFVQQLSAVLEEGILGPRTAWNYFTDGADSSLLATLAGVSAEQASRLIGGTSVAAHVAHLAFALNASNAWIAGDRAPVDWEQSWTTLSVDEQTWIGLQETLQARFETLQQTMHNQRDWDEVAVGSAAGVVAHVAYHLGAIRQKVACLHYM